MERFTEKVDNEYIVSVSMGIGGYTDVAEEKQHEANQKLGKCEDIEDKIKFPLAKAFECLEKGVYKAEWDGEIIHNDIRAIGRNGLYAIDTICDYPECDHLLEYEKYGKTWALTKEELEVKKNV